jgi:hypothetical protein
MSAFGERRNSPAVMSAFGGKADVRGTVPKSPLLARRRHSTGSKPRQLKGRNRPITAIQGRCRERRLSDRKAVVRLSRSARRLIVICGHSAPAHSNLAPTRLRRHCPCDCGHVVNPRVHVVLVVDCDTRMKLYDGRKYRGRGATCMTGQENRRVSNARRPVRQCCLGRDEGPGGN